MLHFFETFFGETVFIILESLLWPFGFGTFEIQIFLYSAYCLLKPFSETVVANCTPSNDAIVMSEFLVFVAIIISFVLEIIYIAGLVIMIKDIYNQELTVNKKSVCLIIGIYIVISVLHFIDNMDMIDMEIMRTVLASVVVPILFLGAYKIIRYLYRRKSMSASGGSKC